ncbi:mycothiol acetyltransferase [Clostridium acetireducens DSM 10703]|uniref:Mycothiol acetyltransferase n=1 Tax=Clostridium acetireducens DSM 10703 TaxID=1121290 RepID=A0A1E8F2A3_9CLOT|nr:GNAT family N-acetyltransferase [Clostridium acetireducens]OFI07764.1 mycothiol acetyltransferase [Clostridium acetireducens DSM 10703]
MYKCIRLNNINIKFLKKLNGRRYIFNTLNENFFDIYNTSNFAQRILLRKRVYLLSYDSNYVGYLWFTPNNKYNYTINALNIVYYTNINLKKACSLLLNSLKINATFNFHCENNGFNFKILKQLGFSNVSGVLKLSLLLNKSFNFKFNNDEISFSSLKLGSEENIRCYIQNTVFKNPNRVPLTIEDIFYDENQNYYFDRGSILVKKKDTYIGYGQIIIQNNIPIIVNVGILNSYRGKGYGEELLKYLINILKIEGFKKAYINVDMNNTIALNLYKKLGFKIKSEKCIWEIKR